MSEARRLLERLLDGHDGPHEHDLNLHSSPCSLCTNLVDEARAYLAMTTCEDVAAAICFLEHSKNTHENWAAWLADGKVASPDAGDLEHHERCVLEYEHVLDVFQDAAAREGELEAALEEMGCSYSLNRPCITSLKGYPKDSWCRRCRALAQGKKA